MGGRVPKSSVKTIVLFILMTNYTLNCKWLKISSKSTKYLENSFIFMVLESNIQFPLKFFRGYSMLKDKIIMILGQSEAFVVCRYFPLFFKANAPDHKAICELLTHFNVSDLIELHNITLAVCLQICSVQSISTQLEIFVSNTSFC